MSSSQRFCLRWNNHQSNLLSVFEQLLQDESFVDVTLAVEGLYLKAHKMVLSACSPYFQTLFVNNPDKHPIVFLKDVPYADMRSLLDFMYKGEVSVDQERLTAFLKVAESLRIKGLTEVNEESCNLPRITSSLLNSVPGNMADERLERHPSPHHFMGKRPSSSPSPLQNLQHLHSRHLSPSYSGKRKRGVVAESTADKERHAGSGRSSPSSSVSGQQDLMMAGQECISSSRSPDETFKDVGGKRIKDEPEPTAGPSSQDAGQNYGNSQDTDEGGSGGMNFGAGDEIMNLTMKIYSSDGAGGVAATNMPLSPGDPADKFDCTTMNRATLLEIKKKCIQESEIIYRCSICLKTYSNFGNFQRHYSTTHMTEKKMFPCPLCHREFTRKDNMQAHVRYTHN